MCLQRNSLSAAEGLSLAAIDHHSTMKSTIPDDKCALFCKDVTTLAEHNLVKGSSTAKAAAFTGTI